MVMEELWCGFLAGCVVISVLMMGVLVVMWVDSHGGCYPGVLLVSLFPPFRLSCLFLLPCGFFVIPSPIPYLSASLFSTLPTASGSPRATACPPAPSAPSH